MAKMRIVEHAKAFFGVPIRAKKTHYKPETTDEYQVATPAPTNDPAQAGVPTPPLPAGISTSPATMTMSYASRIPAHLEGVEAVETLASDRPLDVRRIDIPFKLEFDVEEKPRYPVEIDDASRLRLGLTMLPQDGDHKGVRDSLRQYEFEDQARVDFNRKLLADTGIYHITLDGHSRKVSLWGVAMALAGSYHRHELFGELLTLKGPDDVVALGRNFGQPFFSTTTALRAVDVCARKCFTRGVDNVRVALCARELLVCAMLGKLRDKETDFVDIQNNGLWKKKWENVLDSRRVYYDSITEPDEKKVCLLHQAQELAAVSTIAEGAVARVLQIVDARDQHIRDNAHIIATAAVVGVSAGIAAIAHFPPALAVIIPFMLGLVNDRIIDKRFTVHHYAKRIESRRAQDIAQMQSLYVARYRDGTIPTPEGYIDLRNAVDLYQKAEAAVHGLLGLSQ